MPAPSLASYTVTNDNSLTLATPTGAANGDLLIVVFHADGNSDFDAGSNGFVAGGRRYSPIDSTTEWFYLPLNSAPASSYTFTRTGSGACRAWMIRVTGANLSSPIDVSGFQEDTTSDTTHDLPNLTTAVADTLLLATSLVASGAKPTANEFTAPSGYTKIDEAGAGWVHTAAAWKTQATAGSTGSASFTGVSARSLQLLLAIKPAASGHSLTTQSATLTPSGPSLALSQGHALALQSGSLSLSAPSAVLSQAHALGAGPGSLALEGAALGLSQTLSLSVQSATLAPSAPALGLSQTHTLAFQSATLSLSSTDLAISQGGEILLALQSGTLNLSAPGTALAQTHGLAFQNGTLSVLTTNIALSQGGSHTLSIQNGTLTFSGPSVALGQSHTLTATAGVQGLQSTTVALQQSHSLALAPGSLTLSGSAIAIYSQSLQGSRFVASAEPPRYQATLERLRYWASKE